LYSLVLASGLLPHGVYIWAFQTILSQPPAISGPLTNLLTLPSGNDAQWYSTVEQTEFTGQFFGNPKNKAADATLLYAHGKSIIEGHTCISFNMCCLCIHALATSLIPYLQEARSWSAVPECTLSSTASSLRSTRLSTRRIWTFSRLIIVSLYTSPMSRYRSTTRRLTIHLHKALAPEATLPTQIEQVFAAYKYLRKTKGENYPIFIGKCNISFH